mmetsp:Transcript_84040/g.175785  ORF Transcript_84040/g.175785 Transcript_84040/m.175785 type:complete len:238 (+) Transcript_84040:285-998(+)
MATAAAADASTFSASASASGTTVQSETSEVSSCWKLLENSETSEFSGPSGISERKIGRLLGRAAMSTSSPACSSSSSSSSSSFLSADSSSFFSSSCVGRGTLSLTFSPSVRSTCASSAAFTSFVSFASMSGVDDSTAVWVGQDVSCASSTSTAAGSDAALSGSVDGVVVTSADSAFSKCSFAASTTGTMASASAAHDMGSPLMSNALVNVTGSFAAASHSGSHCSKAATSHAANSCP